MDSFFPVTEISPKIAAELKKLGQQVIYKRKETIIFQGQHFSDLYYINSGFIKYTLFSIGGGVQTICYLGKGFFLGEYQFITRGNTSTVTMEAATELSLLSFKQNVKSRLYEIKGFKKLLLKNMAILTRLVKTQIESLSLYNSEQRIRKTIEDAEEYFTFMGKKEDNKFYLTKKEIADLSGCSLETVNRFLKSRNSKTFCHKVSLKGR